MRAIILPMKKIAMAIAMLIPQSVAFSEIQLDMFSIVVPEIGEVSCESA
jgi:hypothetical protein